MSDSYRLEYPSGRVRGFAPWKPNQKTLPWLRRAAAVINELKSEWPLLVRQVAYEMDGELGFHKNKKSDVDKLENMLARARRAEMIPFSAIDDGRGTSSVPFSFADVDEYHRHLVDQIDARVQIDRQKGQKHFVEVWCEAVGMIPRARKTAHEFGVPVYSGQGTNTLTTNHRAFLRAVARLNETPQRGTVILHIGDQDPGGLVCYNALATDLEQMVLERWEGATLGHVRSWVFVERTAVTEEQIDEYNLPAEPAPADARLFPFERICQAEKLRPNHLAEILDAAIREWVDVDILAANLAAEEELKDELRQGVESGFGPLEEVAE